MFTIYHHNDFDGLATASIFSKYLYLVEKIDLEQIRFVSVDYNLKSNWAIYKLENPCAVLDFLYHSEADWWFDHHNSSFINEASINNPYKRSKQKYWNTSFLSCPSLLVSHLYTYDRKQSMFLKKMYKELITWSDIIDGAKYEKPNDLFGFENPYININKTLALDQSKAYHLDIIRAFYHNDLEILFNTILYKNLICDVKSKENESINILKKIIKVENRVAYFDQSNHNIPFQRYLAYYLFPEVLFRVAIYKKDEQFSVSVNYNNWAKEKNRINLGELCRKLGGGGRFDVGAVLANTHEDAVSKASLLKKWLKSSDVIQLGFGF
jgi:hypothetical protein